MLGLSLAIYLGLFFITIWALILYCIDNFEWKFTDK